MVLPTFKFPSKQRFLQSVLSLLSLLDCTISSISSSALATKAGEEATEPLKYKTWVLRVSIHCEGCKRKVKKVMQIIDGMLSVYDIQTGMQDLYEDCVSAMRLYQNNFASWRQNELERMAPEQMKSK
ncbi:hypothetical protein Syun_001906 [Stephania yunnanensis]|uniref:HMA domain-containing protein n=1 Tax=Stephania yunnanensis TaxID=152371 RepID=A0AAP0QBD3_9MAGN